jgi:hypothetical protein
VFLHFKTVGSQVKRLYSIPLLSGQSSHFGFFDPRAAMSRIVLTLAILNTAGLSWALWLGNQIGNAKEAVVEVQSRVGVHFLVAVGAICLAVLVHALVLTYFMGTGRWLEETSAAYRLDRQAQHRARALKWKLYPAMIVALGLLVTTGGLGAAADPAAHTGFAGVGGLSAAAFHELVAWVAILVNATVNLAEYVVLRRNASLVNGVLAEVRRIRIERGLETEARANVAGTLRVP